MADFELAVAKTIKNEGGDKYTDRKNDRGGPTKYGISEKTMYVIVNHRHPELECSIYLKDLLSPILNIEPAKNKVERLTLNQAKEIYKIFFWNANRYGEINDQAIAEKVFDMAVLMGAPRANKILQKNLPNAICDGILGDKTIRMVNMVRSDNPYTNDHIYSNFFRLLRSDYMEYYLVLCNKDKTQDENLKGWLNRAMS
jgi:lysozyme family protein